MLKNECFIIKKMSFLKISDPLKRDSIVKEYLELKKNIRNNLLSERIGESELQTSLSKFYKPITETQKATTREITEGLKPIREGIEKLPEALQSPAKATEEEEEEEEEEEDDEEEDENIGEIAKDYLNMEFRDKKFGIRKEKGHHYIGNKHVIIKNNDIIIAKTGEKLKGTRGLWELIMSKNPQNFNDMDYDNYRYLITMSNVLHRGDNSKNPYPKASGSHKWTFLLSPIWFGLKPKKGQEGSGVVVIPSDPNALLERLDLLLASQEAGHTGVRNELVSICDELKRQGVLDTKAYKKLNHIIKK